MAARVWLLVIGLFYIGAPKPRSRKRTCAFLFRRIRTLRFRVIARAGRVTRFEGRTRLRLSQNPSVQHLYERLQHALAA